MKRKRILSCACALCIAGCIAPYYVNNYSLQSSSANYSPSYEISGEFLNVRSEQNSNTLNFTDIGQSAEIEIQNTDETPTWYSDNTNIAVVDSSGKVTSVGKGSCTVYAVFSNQVLQFNVIVNVPEEITDFNVGSIELSNETASLKLTLNGIDTSGAVWTSSNPSVATVDNSGTVTAVGSGSCTVTASVNGKNYIVNVTSTYVKGNDPVVSEVQLGTLELSNSSRSAKVNLSGVPEGVTVTWSSDNENVAKVSQDGTVTAVGVGECKITALISGIKYITVVKSSYDPTTATKPDVILTSLTLSNEKPGGTITLSGVPEGTAVIWSSDNENVAKVSQDGTVTAVGSGECKIIALIDGVNYIVNVTSTYTPVKEIEIKADSTCIDKIGGTLNLSVTNTDEKPEWISTNVNVATVDSNGVVTAVSEGEVNIIAKVGDKVLTIAITVKNGILYGDANLDGKLSISDAVMILSYASNPGKFPLENEDICDVYNRGDGIDSMDSLSVQKKITNVISELPESYLS